MFINIAEQEVTLVGFVHEIDEKVRANGIAICTGEEDYEVETNEWHEKLSKEIENDVRVTGFISGVAEGKNRILVSGYEVLYDGDDYKSNYLLYDD